MHRREFIKVGAAGVTSSMLGLRGLALSAACPALATRHGVVIIYGNGVRKKDVVDNPSRAPHHERIAAQGTLFTDDFNDTAELHGYMSTELLTGRDASTEQPRFPTWSEYIRRETMLPASQFWMLQPVAKYRAWSWDRKHYSTHGDFGSRYGATSITTAETFVDRDEFDTRRHIETQLEPGLRHSRQEREQIVAFIADLRARRGWVPPSTRTRLSRSAVEQHDAVCLQVATEILRAFRPRLITVQLLGFDEAHRSYRQYLNHISSIDELVGAMWDVIQADASMRMTTALFIRPDCGRNAAVSRGGRLGHAHGDSDAHYVWSLAAGPDFKRGAVVTDRVNRRDWAPTITYALSGTHAHFSTGSVRTQLFLEDLGLPGYRCQPAGRLVDPKIDLEAL
jgi:hypothetical protein